MSTAELNLGSLGGISRDLEAKLEALKGELAATIQGLPYLFARSTYGNELTLHFGAERPHTHPKLKGKVRGTHILSVRGSAWLLRSGVRPIMVGCGVAPTTPPPGGVKPFNVTALESGALIGQKAKIARAIPLAVEPLHAIGLYLELDDKSEFTIFPTPPDNGDNELPEPADWELLIPNKVLRVGPGPSYYIEKL